MTKPIFIFSLPRSGSTLLQRLLLTSGECASVGEPSLLLRFIGDDLMAARRSVYWEFLVDIGKEDMRKTWKGFDQAYADGIRYLMSSIYSGLAGDKPYFVDKTPRYSLIAREIIQTFPDAYFIVLWRHPLAVAASMYSTLGKGFWFPEEYAIDLHEGLLRLNQVCEDFTDRICEIRYEDLVVEPVTELQRLGKYLGIHNLSSVLDKPLVTNNFGRLGDPTGIKKFNAVSNKSLTAWEDVYDNFYRRRWVNQYVKEERAEIMEKYNYSLPSKWKDDTKVNILGGVKDLFRAAIRRCRKITRPVSHKRFLKEFKAEKGFFPTFR